MPLFVFFTNNATFKEIAINHMKFIHPSQGWEP